MSIGLFEDGEPKPEFTEEELTKISINPPVRREDKKTKQQRRKEKERKKQVERYFYSCLIFFQFLLIIKSTSVAHGSLVSAQNIFKLSVKATSFCDDIFKNQYQPFRS